MNLDPRLRLILYLISQTARICQRKCIELFLGSLFYFSTGLIHTYIYYTSSEMGSRVSWLILGPPLSAGYFLYCLKLARNEEATMRDLLAGFLQFGKVWLLNFYLFVIITIGSILFLIPGLFWFTKYSWSIYSLMDKKHSVLQSLRYSGRITEGYKLVLFVLLMMGLSCVFLNFPFLKDLSNPSTDWSQPGIQIHIIMYIVSIAFYMPYFAILYAVAYDELSRRFDGEILPESLGCENGMSWQEGNKPVQGGDRTRA